MKIFIPLQYFMVAMVVTITLGLSMLKPQTTHKTLTTAQVTMPEQNEPINTKK